MKRQPINARHAHLIAAWVRFGLNRVEAWQKTLPRALAYRPPRIPVEHPEDLMPFLDAESVLSAIMGQIGEVVRETDHTEASAATKCQAYRAALSRIKGTIDAWERGQRR